MTTNDQLPDPQSLGYEEARDELVRIVQTLEGGQAPAAPRSSTVPRRACLRGPPRPAPKHANLSPTELTAPAG